MKLNEKVAAHSLAVLSGAYYILCTLLVFVVPDLYKSVALSWTHGVDMASIWRGTPPDVGTLLWGFVTFTAAAWFTGFAFAWVYNYFIKGK